MSTAAVMLPTDVNAETRHADALVAAPPSDAEMDSQPSEAEAPVAMETVTLYNLPGAVLAKVSPVPSNVKELKIAIEAQTSVPVALQKLIEFGGSHIYEDSEPLGEGSLEMYMLTDEAALFSWDVNNNPGKDVLGLEENVSGNPGSIVTCPRLRTDYCNVLTKEPIRKGVHYFEFVMHHIGDEQSCGLVQDSSQAGTRYSLRSLKAWTYYCGRMGSSYGDIRDGKGALHAEGRAVAEFKKLRASGDIIGMLADLDTGAIAFDLNGELQGACAIPKNTPMWVITHLDTPRDKVELRKPCLMDAPPANLEALQGALLEISSGKPLRGGY